MYLFFPVGIGIAANGGCRLQWALPKHRQLPGQSGGQAVTKAAVATNPFASNVSCAYLLHHFGTQSSALFELVERVPIWSWCFIVIRRGCLNRFSKPEYCPVIGAAYTFTRFQGRPKVGGSQLGG